MEKKDLKAKVELKVTVMQNEYEKHVKQWDGNFNDDRQVFCNIYKQSLLALCEMEKCNVTNNTIWVALNELIKKNRETMDGILTRFNG